MIYNKIKQLEKLPIRTKESFKQRFKSGYLGIDYWSITECIHAKASISQYYKIEKLLHTIKKYENKPYSDWASYIRNHEYYINSSYVNLEFQKYLKLKSLKNENFNNSSYYYSRHSDSIKIDNRNYYLDTSYVIKSQIIEDLKPYNYVSNISLNTSYVVYKLKNGQTIKNIKGIHYFCNDSIEYVYSKTNPGLILYSSYKEHKLQLNKKELHYYDLKNH